MTTRTLYTKLAISSVVSALAVLALACDRQSGGDTDDPSAAGESAQKTGEGEAADREPLPGVDVDDLGPGQLDSFHSLVDAVSSPCGEAHSLRTSVVEDDDCHRAGHAAEYVAQLVRDGASEHDARQMYEARYREDPTVEEFSHDDVPRKGPSDARVEIVEFLDYGCPACKHFGEVSERAQQAWPNDVAVYYRFFPLPSNPTGEEAARAAVAAKRQGKFEDMHEMLFRYQGQHHEASLRGYAEEIGLDMDQFDEDFEASGEIVSRDQSRGREAGVSATPTVYINGREFTDPKRFEYVKMWIEEELALN